MEAFVNENTDFETTQIRWNLIDRWKIYIDVAVVWNDTAKIIESRRA